MNLLICVAILQFFTVTDIRVRSFAHENINLDNYLQPLDVGRNLTYDRMIDDGKICARDCTRYPESRICYFKFVAEQYHAMGPACKNCPISRNDCFSRQCITADGIERTVLSFNRMIPGPSINVCFGDRIIVDVQNKMPARELTVHWHGELQESSPWMDGVPLVTQCPITECNIFRYDFRAYTASTHFYHSHAGFELYEGLSGSLVVRLKDKKEPLRKYYDHDLFSHTIQIQDWMHVLMDVKYPGYNKNRTLINARPDTYLINGKGAYMNPVTLKWTGTPFAEFKVKQNQRYRFRIIGITSSSCSYQFTFENHEMLLIATDGYPIEPKRVRTLYMSAGDIYDVVIETNRTPRSYWIRVQGYSGECTPAFQQAILRYEGNDDPIPLTANTEALFNALPFPVLNNVRMDCHTGGNLCVYELKSHYRAHPQLLKEKPDYQFFFKITAHLFTPAELYMNDKYYRHYLPVSGPGVTPLGGIFTDSINNMTNIMPPFPLWNDPRNSLIDKIKCPEKCNNFCECLHLVRVKRNSVVEIILIDTISSDLLQMDHTMHLHGHHFSVLKFGSKKDLEKPDYFKADLTNQHPVIKDTVTVPASGFAVIRFIADNPGFWPLHCHFTIHNISGMKLIFQVGDPSEFLTLPDDWPTCGNYLPPVRKNV